MAKQMVISLSIDGQPEVTCLSLRDNEPGLGLSREGVTWGESASVLLSMDENEELIIKNTGHELVELERFGRRHVLQIHHPIRVAARDVVRIGGTNPHMIEIRRIYRTQKPLMRFNGLSKLAMIASATSMVMMSHLACQRTEPQNAAQTSVNADSSQSDPEMMDTDSSLPDPEIILEELESPELYEPRIMGDVAPAPTEEIDIENNEPDVVETIKDSVP